MIFRLLVILTLALPGLALRSAPAQSGANCCAPVVEVVVEETCCAKPAAEAVPRHHCGMTDDTCRCAAPTPANEPQPKAPSTRPGELPIVVLPASHTGVTPAIEDPRSPRRAQRTVVLTALRTHNESQALLSVWRT